MSDAPPSAPAARWSRLAWITLVVGMVPTCVGQLLAPVLGLIALLEIRTSRGLQRGRLPAWGGVVASVAWIGVFAWGAQHQIDHLATERTRVVGSASACRARMGQLATAWSEANAVDSVALDALDPARVLLWLVTEGYVEAEHLRCPSDTEASRVGSYRFMPPVPISVLPPESCIVLYEARPRHRENARRGRNVVFYDGSAAFLDTALFRQTLDRQRDALVAWRNQ